jgi:hypothetical protein
MAKERLSLALVALAVAAALSITALPTASGQRLSGLLTPSDLAALRDEAAGVFGVSRKGDKGGGASPADLLDAPDVACADEKATNVSVTLDVCTGPSGAPFGVVVDWMDVLAFARNNGWFRGDDDRLCRLRLTEPIASGGCRAVMIGGEDMLRQLLRPPHHHHGDKEHENGNKKHQGQTKSYDGSDNNHSDDGGGKHGGDDDGPAQQPDDAVLGAESCLDALEPGTYYVFRARARGDRDAQRRDEGGDEEGKNKDEEGQQDAANKDDEGEEKKRRERATDPSLWSDNAVCETLADGEGDGPDVIEMVPL